MIPKSLSEVAELTAHGESFDLSLRNFRDRFSAQPEAVALTVEPVRLRTRVPKLGEVEDAYLAATAEWLAQRYQFALPIWPLAEDRRLRRPWFASELASLRAVLLLESPAPFRARNLFVSENALSRA